MNKAKKSKVKMIDKLKKREIKMIDKVKKSKVRIINRKDLTQLLALVQPVFFSFLKSQIH